MASEIEPGILVRALGSVGPWDAPELTAYENESHLQQIIATGPQHVPGVPPGSLTVRELQTSAGPADVCIVGLDGSITVVECKLESNAERRRMVIGQVLDYASAIWLGGTVAFRDQWDSQSGEDLNVLGDEALEQLDQNITAGRVGLCLAVDRIDDDLKRLVEFLNRITRDEVAVTALQLMYARHGDIEILRPSTFGGEIAAAKARASRRAIPSWTRDTFLDSIGSDSDRALAERLFELLDKLDTSGRPGASLWFGTQPGGGVFLKPFGFRYAPLQLWIHKDGRLMAFGNWNQWDSIRQHPAFADLAEFVGQDHRSTARSFPLADHDVEDLWRVVLTCATRINE